MAITVGLTTQPSYKELTTYSYYTFQGLTTTSDSFIQNLDATGASAWYVFDPSVTAYVPFGLDALVLLSSNVDTTANSISNFVNSVKNYIEIVATNFGYDSSLDFISYQNSGITAWRNESLTFGEWRDNTISLMYENVASFTGGGPSLPNIDGFTGQTGYFDVGITASRPLLFS